MGDSQGLRAPVHRRPPAGSPSSIQEHITHMAYLTPSEYTTKAIDAGASKVLMSTRDTLIRACLLYTSDAADE